jgi:predicted  nucleic acid-binding Zn-ribbon protein
MKELPSGKQEIEVAAKSETDTETLERLYKRIQFLERELAGAEDRYRLLMEQHTKLSDIWMAFQATARPTQRNVHRAEAAGEFARKLTEALIRAAYPQDEFGRG